MVRRVTVEGIRADDVADAVGGTTIARGREYVAQGAVLHSEWDDAEHVLRALVRGRQEQVYVATVWFEPDGLGDLELAHGECSCPVGVLCKHVAGAALSAVTEWTAPTPPSAPAWESTLEALLHPPTVPAPGEGALAIELAPDGSGRLPARLLRRGAKGWVRGSLTWDRMLQPRATADHRPDHLALVRELYLLHQAACDDTASPYRYHGYGADEKTIDLATLRSSRLWPLLDEAADVGLVLLPSRHGLGPLDRYRRAELPLDVTAGPDAGSLAVRPVLRFAGEHKPDPDARPVAFLGGELAHGVVHVSAAEGLAPASCRLRLARLDPPAPRSIWQAALDGGGVTIPPDQVHRFRERFTPRLARLRMVSSSDGTYEPPVIGAPILVLQASFGADHALGLGWQWRYDVGGTDVRTPVTGAVDDYRDLSAEREVLRALDDVPVDWDRFGLRSAAGLTSARLTGVETAAFSIEALPALEDTDAVRVERFGEQAGYREVGDELAIAVSTSESDTGADWFDLGISITVEEQEIPFKKKEALVAGVMDDGAFTAALDADDIRALVS